MASDGKPISLHPLFPPIVAAWFAVLLGIGAMVLPVILLERGIVATGIAAYLPAAAPPLGPTARGLIAAVAAFLGAGMGMAVARRVARSHETRGEAPAAPVSVCRPISAHDELGDEGLAPSPAERHSLLSAEEAWPSDFLMLKPMSAEDRYADTSELPAATDPVLAQALELSALEIEPPLENEPAPFAPSAADDEQEVPMTDEPLSPFPSLTELERRREERRKIQDGKAAVERRLYLRRTSDEPLPFFAPSLARAAVNENIELEAAAPEFEVTVSSAQPDALEEGIALDHSGWQQVPLEQLGMVQLVTRLQASLETFRLSGAGRANAEPPAALPVVALDEVEVAPAIEAAQARAEYFGQATGEPAEQPVPGTREATAAYFGQGADEPAGEAVADAAPENGEDGDEESFGSLLALRNPFVDRPEFMRVEEPAPAAGDGPVAPLTFPGEEHAGATRAAPRPFDPPGAEPAAVRIKRPAPADSEKALRKALATLQRMSNGH